MTLILGMGITGFSVARFLTKQKQSFIMLDSRKTPPLLNDFLIQFPNQTYFCGALDEIDEKLLENTSQLIVSPGLNLEIDFIKLAKQKNIKILGDMDLFFKFVNAPVIGITGTNGKSTVTTLVTQMINDAGLKAVMGGNIGKASLDCLAQNVDFYVLELSSYQLDLTQNMPLEVAVVLNISEDHTDRYPIFTDYIKSKLSIYSKAKTKVVNADDKNINIQKGVTFSLTVNADFAKVECHNNFYLLHNDEVLLNTNQLNILGEHNHSNVLSSLALGDAIGLDRAKMLESVKTFDGLKHRLQKVASINNIDYFNDSKATNSEASMVAIKAIASIYKNIVMIVGGVTKEDSYEPLAKLIKDKVNTVVLIGQSSIFFLKEFKTTKTIVADDMDDAVMLATRVSKTLNNTAVLLSPTCASFDMFKNFEHRGEVFIKAVKNLTSI